MQNSPKSGEEVHFRWLFQELKNGIKDDPEDLPNLARDDKPLKALCRRLAKAARRLDQDELNARNKFTGPVDPSFIDAWRDYQIRYQRHVEKAAYEGLASTATKAESAKLSAEAGADFINKVFDIAEDADDNGMFEGEHDDELGFPLSDVIRFGASFWHSIQNDVGIDLQGIIRRKRLLPFVQIPKNVSDKYGESEKQFSKPSLYSQLQAAHDAFVLGVPLAAVALMRSTMETVLRKHYGPDIDRLGPEGRRLGLKRRIEMARLLLPEEANQETLMELKDLADSILHVDEDRTSAFLRLSDEEMEKKLVTHLEVLATLIQKAPRRPRRK